MFSIIIPSWNNLAYLKLCIESIRKNSRYDHQVVVHVNDGSDGTLAYIKEQGLDYSHSLENIGICYAVNEATLLCKGDYIVYLNDDMYVCPDWDYYLQQEIEQIGHNSFMLSGTLIEPEDTGNACVIVHNYGDSLSSFDEAGLLTRYSGHDKEDWAGSAWPPTVVSKDMWLKVGGYSIEFSPGMSSDDDFAMKMWFAGCRIFKGIARSRVYHFQARSTQRIDKNDGRRQFLHKWGIKQSSFNKYYLRRGEKYTGPLTEPTAAMQKKEKRKATLKIILHNLHINNF